MEPRFDRLAVEWERYRKAGAAAFARLAENRSPVTLGDLADECQAKPCAPVALSEALYSIEWLKNAISLGFGDAGPTIANADNRVGPFAPRRHLGHLRPTIARRILKKIAK